ncbi:hypothetical protein M378DRAFT_25846 [Amanita muscaria Koide BX008]|uniref:Uncharacterized protein n=1 Tax=Amanita muscaria (strain Koide BX008) TaxID=946122 RepID=A0A0C2SFW5_AMAMK|nr:hypothetical protein M378DRAFT_25846 [Amanita muscaria Koide BX008]
MDTATHSHPSRPTTATGEPVFMYKGKVTRSWPQLPDELVRHIATFYLWDASVNSYCPQVWETRELWHHRMLYTSIRDALLLEKNIMPICPQWSKALETHYFWLHAISLIDPQDALAHHAVIHPPKPPPQSNENSRSSTATQAHQDQPIQPTRLTPYCHYRNILTYSCHVCRVNQPNSSAGLTTAKRLLPSPLLGPIAVCREHDRRRIAFCGICMREAPLFEGTTVPPSYVAAGINPNTALTAQAYNGMSLESIVSCLENEDEETWPGVAATCRFCRREWLWRKATNSARDREAIGGPKLSSEDWETRQCVDGFIDLAEGSINDVISLAREKWWLRKYTKLGDMMLQALAAARFTNAGAAGVAAVSTRRTAAAAARGGGDGHAGGDGSMHAPDLEEEEEEEEEEDDEEDPELMQFTEEGGVRDLALGDWARSRILDGHWFSPADLWYRNVVPGKDIVVPAIHPCPWARDDLGLDTGGDSSADSNGEEEEHPRPATVNAEIPPSYGLCEQAYIAHQRQMRVVMLSPMKNIVRRLVMECFEDTKGDDRGDCTWGGSSDDPALRATKMSLEDVVKILREEEGIWFDGVDWAERRRNNARDRMAGIAPDPKPSAEVTSTSPTSGSGSGSSETESSNKSGASSSATSPVLSTTTLQTTPSPPPVSSSSPSSLDVAPREPDGDMDDVSSNEGPRHAHGKDRAAPLPPPSLPPRPPPRLITIAVSPVLNPPKLLRPIPYVPVTLSHLPHYSIEAFRAVWREACAPLYHCRCKICERAMVKANADAATNTRPNGTVPVSSLQSPESQTRSINPQQAAPNSKAPNVPGQQSGNNKRPVEIKLNEVAELDGEGEEEVEELEEYSREEGVEYEEYEEEEEEDLEVSSTFGEYGEARESYSPSSLSRTGTTPDPEASLPVDEGQEDPGEDHSEDSHSSRSRQHRHRQCRSGAVSNSDDDDSYLHRSRKRSSDELDEEKEEEHRQGSQLPDLRRRKREGTPPKKARKSDSGGAALPESPVISPLSSPTKSRGCGHYRNAAAASPKALQTSSVVTKMRKRSSEELEEDEDGEDDDLGDNTSVVGFAGERTRRDSRNSRNGSDGSSRGRNRGQVTRGSRGGGGSSSDRERGENKIAPYKRLKVSSDGGGSDGE